MPDPQAARLDLTPVLRRFPGRAALVARLAEESEAFRGICEDLGLAIATLARLSARPDAERDPVVERDYERVVAELENDVEAALAQVEPPE